MCTAMLTLANIAIDVTSPVMDTIYTTPLTNSGCSDSKSHKLTLLHLVEPFYRLFPRVSADTSRSHAGLPREFPSPEDNAGYSFGDVISAEEKTEDTKYVGFAFYLFSLS